MPPLYRRPDGRNDAFARVGTTEETAGMLGVRRECNRCGEVSAMTRGRVSE